MTQEEKDRRDRINSKEYRYWLQTGRTAPNSDVGLKKANPKAKRLPQSEDKPSFSIPKLNKDTSDRPGSSKASSKSSSGRISPSMNKPHSNSTKTAQSSKPTLSSEEKARMVAATMKKLKLPSSGGGKFVDKQPASSHKSSSSKSSASVSKSSSATSSKSSRPPMTAKSSQKGASQVRVLYMKLIAALSVQY